MGRARRRVILVPARPSTVSGKRKQGEAAPVGIVRQRQLTASDRRSVWGLTNFPYRCMSFSATMWCPMQASLLSALTRRRREGDGDGPVDAAPLAAQPQAALHVDGPHHQVNGRVVEDELRREGRSSCWGVTAGLLSGGRRAQGVAGYS